MPFEVSFTKDAAFILFYNESDDKESLKKLIDEELKKDLVSDELVEQLRRRMLGSSFKVLNTIEDFATGYIRDILNDIDYFKEIDNIINIKKDDIVNSFKELDLSNYSLIHISPLNK